jgi:hypothetical protein
MVIGVFLNTNAKGKIIKMNIISDIYFLTTFNSTKTDGD